MICGSLASTIDLMVEADHRTRACGWIPSGVRGSEVSML